MKKLKFLFLIMCLFIPFLVAGCGEDKSPMATPQNLSVQNGIIVFDAVKDAQYYNICVDELSFDVYVNRNDKAQQQDGKVKYNASDILEYGKTYSIKVKACHTERDHSEYTSVISYLHIKDLETISNPNINNGVISWDEVLNATEYEIKIITPNDKVLLDEQGNVLTGEVANIIEQANLNVYKTSNNQFDYTSIITTAGEYTFYVRAIFNDYANVAYGNYLKAGSYEHFIKLTTPKIITIAESENDLHLTTIVDKNANQISIVCGEFVTTENIAGNVNIEKTGNVLDINITEAFKDIKVNGKSLDLSQAKEYSFYIIAQNKETYTKNYFLDSEESAPKSFLNKVEIYAPTNVTLTYDAINNSYIASWDKSCSSDEYVVGYKVLVATSTSLSEYSVNASTFNYMLGEDVIAVAVSSIGPTNYYKSNISEFVQNPNLTLSISNFNPVVNGTGLTWDNVGNYYIVIVNNQIYTTSFSTFTIEQSMAISRQENVKIIAVKKDYELSEKEIVVNMQKRLDTPTTIDNVTEYYNTTIYLTPNSEAIGYYIYVSKDGVLYNKTDELFTIATINLKDYITPNSEYKIKVQAVANKYSMYVDSSMSEVISITLPKKLNKPTWFSIGQEVKPIIQEDSTKYLYFYGVENANSYEILINYNIKTISAMQADQDGLFKIDVTNYMKIAGNVNIKVKAISANPSYTSSDYLEYSFKQIIQLDQVQNVRISKLDATYTLTFDEVDNATVYKVRITNPNGDINVFETSNTSYDVTNYIQGTGSCYVFVTASSSNENYIDSATTRLVVQID